MGHFRNLLLGLAAAAAFVMPGQAQPAAMRDRLVVLTSSSARNVTELLASSFTERFEGVNPPTVRALPTGTAFEMFCAGIGPQTPDLLVAVRRMPRSTLETCQGNGVRDVMEVQLGLGAVVLAVRRGEAAPSLTSRQIWEALAAERIREEEFVPNRLSLWSDVSPSLPRGEIRVILPEQGNGTTALFQDLVMETGCRDVKAVRLLFEAAYRRSKCITVRDDGRVRFLPETEVRTALLASPPGTVGLMSYDHLLSSGGNLVALSIDGVLPTQASIFAQDYGATRTLYLYAKRQHTRSQDGIGVVRGIREFLGEATGEPAVGPGGYLAVSGLVPLGPAERAAQRRTVERLSLMSR